MNKLNFIVFLVFFTSTVSVRSHTDEPSVSFIENKGQWESFVSHKASIGGGFVWLEQDGFTFLFENQEDVKTRHDVHHDQGTPNVPVVIRQHGYKLKFIGADPAEKNSQGKKTEYYNYFLGNDPSKWAGDAAAFNTVQYKGIYKGIDLIVSGKNGHFKYDFIVQPGSDPESIRWKYEGVEVKLQGKNILLNTNAGAVIENAPVAWQIINGEKKEVKCHYKLKNGEISFDLPSGYDPSLELIIDPTLIFSSYSGSTADNWGYTATYDNNGSLYSGSIAFSSGYPTIGAYDATFNGGTVDVVISKFSASGNNLVYSTYLGGSSPELPHSLITDSNNNLYIYGTTGSNNFPVTAGCYDNSFNGGSSVTVVGITFSSGSDIFVTSLSAAGNSLNGSTYVGGTGNDGLNTAATLNNNYADQMRGEIILDASENVYVASSTRSSDFPTIAGVVSTSLSGTQDGCAFKLNSSLTALSWSTYIGGTNNDAAYSVKVSDAGNVFICGGTLSSNFHNTGSGFDNSYGGAADGYIIKLAAADGSYLNATYLGTTSYDQAYILDLDDEENVYVVGQTKGAYPVSGGVYSNANSTQFIHKLDNTLSTTGFSTVFGSGSLTNQNISPTAFLVDNCKNIYVSGWGGSTNTAGGNTFSMPLTPDAYDATTDGSDFYFIVLERNALSLLYGSYFGGSPAEHVDGGTSRFDKNGIIYQAVCAGCGGSNNFPTSPGVWSTTNNSSNCNLGAIKMEFNYQGVEATANAAPNIIACDPPYDVTFSGSTGVPDHYWNFGDGSGTSLLQNPTYTFADTGSFSIMYVAIDSSTCNIADTTYLSVIILEPQQFDAVFNIPPFDPCTPGPYTITLQYTGTGEDSLVWNLGDGNSYVNVDSLSHSYVNPGTYIVSVTAYDYDCGLTESVTDTVYFNPSSTQANANAAPNVIACDPPFDVNFSGSSGVPDHYWDFGDGSPVSNLQNPLHTFADTGAYTVMYIAIDSSTCNISDTVYLSVTILEPQAFSATFNIPPFDPCSQDSLIVNLQYTGTGEDSLVWNMGDGTIFSDIPAVTHAYTQDGIYIITLTAYDFDCNRVESISDTIVYNSTIVLANADASPDVIACDPPFVVNFSNGGGTSPDHFWDFGDGTGTSTLANPAYTFSSVGNYSVMYVAIDSSSCNISDTSYVSVTILQSEQFSASFSEIPPQPCKDTVYVNVSFTGSGADSLVWDMGDGVTFTDVQSIYYAYYTPGSYTMTLTAFDFECNKTGSISQEISVDESVTNGVVLLPNVISPNGDLLNEYFVPFYSNLPDYDLLEDMEVYEVEIYNRWGVKVFDSASGNKKWDGKIENDKASEGVYFYIVSYQRKCWDDAITTVSGHVSITR